MPNHDAIQIERSLATAHRALWRAHFHAEVIGSAGEGLLLDLEQILEAVRRVNEAMLKDRLSRRALTDPTSPTVSN
jgi:hypothetical protein